MKLTVKVLGKSDDFDIDVPDETIQVSVLKHLIECKRGIPFNSQRILFKGKTLSDAKSTKDYGIEDSCKLHLSIKTSETVVSAAKEAPIISSNNPSHSNEDFLIKLEKILRRHFTPGDAEKVFLKFSEVYEGIVDAVSLDDIERIANYEIENCNM